MARATIEVLTRATLHPNMRAFQRVIRSGESNQTPGAYTLLAGGKHFSGFLTHPRIRNEVRTRTGVIWSTAAGAYQIRAGTWDDVVEWYALSDFTPASQDLAAVGLIARRGALGDVIAGRITDAIEKCVNEWASFPGGHYEQAQRSLEHLLEIYKGYDGQFA